MPVPDQRDPEITRRRLTTWLAGRLPGAEVSSAQTPATTGFSAETLLFDVVRDGRTEGFVAKVAPTGYQIFPEPRFAEQYRLLRVLGERTAIPVPPALWFEPDPSLLGAPFYVMGRIDGRAPADMPPYHQDGWVTEISPEERAGMWWAGLDVLAGLHRLDVSGLSLEFVDMPEYGPAGLDQRLGYYEHYLRWAYGGRVPVAEEALGWLRANRPSAAFEERPVLLWGDARIGNILFDSGEAQAVLDWEMATLGRPEEDLAWYLYLDRHHSEGVGAPRLEGFPGPEETIARYEKLLGRPMRDMRYFEVLSGFKFAVIMARIAQLMIHYELIPAGSDFPHDNTASRLLARVLSEA